MSASVSVLNACPNLQVELDANWQNCHSIREPLPFHEFITSQENTERIIDIVIDGPSKIKNVDVRYDRRIAESAVNSNQDTLACASTTTRADYTKRYSIDTNQNLQVDEMWDIKMLNTICRDGGVFMASRIQHLIDALMRKQATVAAVQAVALAGGWASDVAGVIANELNVQTFKTGSTDTLYPLTAQKIDNALQKSGYCAPVAIFGGSTLEQYYKTLQIGCCSDGGIDLRSMFDQFGRAVMWDRRVKSAFASEDKSLVTQLGSLQLLQFSEFEGNPLEGGDYRRMMIRDPLTGQKIDMTLKDNCGVISVVLTATAKVIALPDDMFADGDVYDGITYTGIIKVANS